MFAKPSLLVRNLTPTTHDTLPNPVSRTTSETDAHTQAKNTSLRAIPTLDTHELTTVTTNSSAGYRRDPPASYSGILSGMLGGIRWRAALVGYSARCTGELLWRDTRLGGIHWRATLGYSAGYSAGSAGELLWRDARRDPLAGDSAASTGEPLWDLAGSTGGMLWFHWRAALALAALAGTWRDPLASSSGGILGGIHWRAALAGYSAGSTSGGTLGGIRRAALAGYSAGSTGELLWQDTRRDPLASCSGGILGGGVVEASQTRTPVKSHNPFLSGAEQSDLPHTFSMIEILAAHALNRICTVIAVEGGLLCAPAVAQRRKVVTNLVGGVTAEGPQHAPSSA